MATVLDNPYFQNVVSDFITLVLLISFGTVTYRVTRRRGMLKFFECAESRRLLVCLSNLSIDLWSAKDLDGQSRSFSGSAVPAYEARLLPVAYRTFTAPVPGIDDQRGFIRFLALRDLDLNVAISPLSPGELQRKDTIIAVGSAGYNVASVVAESPESSPSGWLSQSGADEVLVVSDGSIRRFYGVHHALVQKVYNSTRHQWIFEVAGSTTDGTTQAYYYLLRNWPRLARRYGTGHGSEFAIVLDVEAAIKGSGVAYESRPLSSSSRKIGRIRRRR